MARDDRSSGIYKALILFVALIVVGVVAMEVTGVTNLTATAPRILSGVTFKPVELIGPDSRPTSASPPISPSPLANSGIETGYWPEIHSKHFLHGYPIGTPQTNDLIIRDIYVMSNNDETKFADWVAYRLDEKTMTSDVKTSRKWLADPWLAEDETLEPEDYKDAHTTIHTDRGHQVPLASFKGTEFWHETNYLSNITPQRSELNQGPWVRLETAIRDLVKKRGDDPVFVMTGPVYSDDFTDSLPGADEPHRVPSGYWKIVSVPNQDGMLDRAVGFYFDQETERSPIFSIM